ncbi:MULTISPECIES: Sec-independent protein translocase subunit TatA [unclassified Streptomyces]|uniref:Sec-independent protein translocase subunit TatA n=1 Tax=unclassified Streptomyces TaxID=2593676 RepID=UPI00225060D5|nr:MULTISPECIES: Sec-independent protein translocase subunit TatA [unclassified Streptomyces]MCX4527268.1 Sec-independent protein translocase subunit TatA [Streptomyces sp. NBC_01551]MCX4542152.1 Sec-independent protein translocase subunit TatA [Streptomyces sp. NBC_01565]
MLRNALEPWHLAILLIVCLLVFGSKKLPEMARGVGKSLRILKAETRALRGEQDADPEPTKSGRD